MQVAWEGKGIDEVGKDRRTGKTIVRMDRRYFRPTEVDVLLGDPSKARKQLGWKPEVTFDRLVEMLVRADWDAMQGEPSDAC
jgi:GDPmannose 4,6-dehydratase